MVYDASQLNQSQGLSKPKPQVTVKMIDFAHVLHANGEEDENYVFGLENLISFFSNSIS